LAEVYANALQTIIGEFKNVSPEIVSSFIFLLNGQVIARDGDISTDMEKKVISTVEDIREQGKRLGSLETLTIQGAEGQLNITSIGSLCLVTVSSRAADRKIIKTLTQVIVPTVVKLAEELAPELAKNKPLQNVELELPVEAPTLEEYAAKASTVFSSQALIPDAPVNQFIVEKIGGFMVAADTVRVDSELVSKWSDLYGGLEIKAVEIKTFEGKTVACKFKPIKEANSGVIQIPEKLLQALQTSKGNLVTVKPVVEPKE
jgi:hypothetical protein